jgi:two-component system, chemotaxis family, protein-glutamate methylesterase/glutaminase
MDHHDVIALGASAGGFNALRELLSQLPSDLPAAVFIVLHLRAHAPDRFAHTLGHDSSLRVEFAMHGEKWVRGRVYLAPPDQHMLIEGERIFLAHGPRENGSRPAIDPTFRSIAANFGGRAIGGLLTGMLNDGTSGLIAIQECGGLTVIQDPRDALYPSMPLSAMSAMQVDYIVPLAELAQLLLRLVNEPQGKTVGPSEQLKLEIEIAKNRIGTPDLPDGLGTRSTLTCPQCNGVLWEISEGGLLRFRCHSGHTYTLDSLAVEQASALSRALANAVRALAERVALMRRMAEDARNRNQMGSADEWERRAQEYEEQVQVIRNIMLGGLERQPLDL